MPFNHGHLWTTGNENINATEKNVPCSINFVIIEKIKNDEKKS